MLPARSLSVVGSAACYSRLSVPVDHFAAGATACCCAAAHAAWETSGRGEGKNRLGAGLSAHTWPGDHPPQGLQERHAAVGAHTHTHTAMKAPLLLCALALLAGQAGELQSTRCGQGVGRPNGPHAAERALGRGKAPLLPCGLVLEWLTLLRSCSREQRASCAAVPHCPHAPGFCWAQQLATPLPPLVARPHALRSAGPGRLRGAVGQ